MVEHRFASRAKAYPIHPYAWLWESLESEASFIHKSMFGCRAVYLDEKIVLCFACKSEPWHGVLIPTDRERHAALIAKFPMLSPHPILPKWLYLSDATASFESTALELVSLVQARDSRIGVIPKTKKSRKTLSIRSSLVLPPCVPPIGASDQQTTEGSP